LLIIECRDRPATAPVLAQVRRDRRLCVEEGALARALAFLARHGAKNRIKTYQVIALAATPRMHSITVNIVTLQN
jgi:hypothetical protein